VKGARCLPANVCVLGIFRAYFTFSTYGNAAATSPSASASASAKSAFAFLSVRRPFQKSTTFAGEWTRLTDKFCCPKNNVIGLRI